MFLIKRQWDKVQLGVYNGALARWHLSLVVCPMSCGVRTDSWRPFLDRRLQMHNIYGGPDKRWHVFKEQNHEIWAMGQRRQIAWQIELMEIIYRHIYVRSNQLLVSSPARAHQKHVGMEVDIRFAGAYSIIYFQQFIKLSEFIFKFQVCNYIWVGEVCTVVGHDTKHIPDVLKFSPISF